MAEQAFDLQSEISVMVARNPSGEVVAYPAATNHHEQQILVWSALPSSIPPTLEKRAQEIATTMARQLKLEGLLAVEMFVTSGDGLYVNELAPARTTAITPASAAAYQPVRTSGARGVRPAPGGCEDYAAGGDRKFAGGTFGLRANPGGGV